MYTRLKQLNTPEEYEFPFKPYPIQQEFMQSVYAALENGNIAILESPTGTGKSLTLTCAALRWLEDHQKLVREELNERITDAEQEIRRLEENSLKAVDWISAQHETQQQRAELDELKQVNKLIEEYDRDLLEIRERKVQRSNRKIVEKPESKGEEDLEKEFLSESQLMQELKDVLETNSFINQTIAETNRYRDTQIFYCSRTHSQLAQIVREVKSTAYGQRVRCVSLASRQQLCVNSKVKCAASTALINDRCLELSEKSVKLTKSPNAANTEDTEKSAVNSKRCGCPFKTASAVQQLGETALAEILDIEELANEGETQKACAYYAARNAATAAGQLIMLPYQTLLHQRTRKRSGICIKGAIVIIDEAHNLLDTIAQLHSCELTLKQLLEVRDAMSDYKMRYIRLLSAANLLTINQLLQVAKNLIKLLQPKPLSPSHSGAFPTRILRTYQLSSECNFDNFDLFGLLEFCVRTRFAQKLQGFGKQGTNETTQQKENQPPKENATLQMLKRLEQHEMPSTSSSKNKKENDCDVAEESQPSAENTTTESKSSVGIYNFLSFIESLTEDAEDGRILVRIESVSATSSFKYIVLNPSSYFADIVSEARAIIIAGGTMQPTNELTEQLFHACPERVRLHFYDHVVSADAVLPFIVQKGPAGRMLHFDFKQREELSLLSELTMILQNLCQVVPAGVVCFFPSYSYLDKFYTHLNTTKALTNIAAKKTIFREPRGGPPVEQMLKDYAIAIKHKGGALLLSVVGGKLSEGLNFKDDLCRGVVVVGMPYANKQTPELKERISYMNQTMGNGAGDQYYENLCMKAVNQCIGRAVRHIRDYAAVYLLDERYAKENIQKKLPKWIARSLQLPATFGAVQSASEKYFKQKKE